MKKTLLTAMLVICGIAAFAQQYDVIDQVKSDWRKMSAMEGIHRFDWAAGNLTDMDDHSIPEFTRPPKGYKPFYISHYGRHGSRYAWDGELYTYLLNVFTDAHNAGALTAEGEDFYKKYIDFYWLPRINTGDLTELGFLQHRRLGRYVYDAFPEVFKPTESNRTPRVEAISSLQQRCIVSMGAFCQAMQAQAPWLDFRLSSTHEGMARVVPTYAPDELQRQFKGFQGEVSLMDGNKFRRSIVDYDGIAARVFSNTEFIKGYDGGRTRFQTNLFSFLGSYLNYCDQPIFDGILTEEQMIELWEANNYDSFSVDIRAQYRQIPLLEDIINNADGVISGQRDDKVADLRFGHDFVMEAFLFLINANGCGTIPATEAEVKYWFQSYNIPMAATILFVFYQKKGADDILFKLIWNEAEATLPQLTPVESCYYRWSDFTGWARELIESQEK